MLGRVGGRAEGDDLCILRARHRQFRPRDDREIVLLRVGGDVGGLDLAIASPPARTKKAGSSPATRASVSAADAASPSATARVRYGPLNGVARSLAGSASAIAAGQIEPRHALDQNGLARVAASR